MSLTICTVRANPPESTARLEQKTENKANGGRTPEPKRRNNSKWGTGNRGLQTFYISVRGASRASKSA